MYAPPRRQQELRKLKIALSCPIKRPSGVGPDDLIHPLPTGRERDRNCGYLYRTQDGKWIKDITPESYKTGATYGHQDIEIPNIKFPDGKCFYDYLETWLYGYYIAPDGGWRSCGTSFHAQGEFSQRLYSGRMILEPIDDHVFVQINGGKPFSESNLSKFVSTAAHRLTGQRLTPHLLRDIYATHFLDQGATDAEISSLAYAMGHSPKTLRETYDRRHPQQKYRPIQEAVFDLVQQSLDPSSTFN